MIFGRRTQHKLPKFPSEVASIFKAMCETISEDAKLEELRQAVAAVLADVEQQVAAGQQVDVDSTRALADCCQFLLSRYHDFPPEQQALIVGAVRYFAVADDPFDDSTFASGLFDDKKVMNHVLERLGIEDRYLEV